MNTIGNENFRRLVGFIRDRSLTLPFSIKNQVGTRAIREFRNRLVNERQEARTTIIDLIETCLLSPDIQNMLQVGDPRVTDFSDLLELRRGHVYGLEFRLMGPAGSHKDLMVGALIVAQVMAGILPFEGINTLTDAGFFNSAWATKFYANLFGFKGAYFIQDTTPRRLLRQLEGENFEVVKIPEPKMESSIDKKNATYRALLRKFYKDKNFRAHACHLGHAEIGNFAVMPYGRMFSRLLTSKGITPQVLATGVGAGTTLMGIGEPLQECFGLELVVLEYAGLMPLKSKMPDHYAGEISDDKRSDLGILEKVKSRGYDIGLTSAAGLAAASYLAEKEDITVVTPIFERFRDYTKNARKIISRALELNPFIPEDFWPKVGRIYSLR